MQYLRRKKGKSLLLFVVPALVIYTIFIICSIFLSGYYSLTKWNAISAPVFQGFDNYVKLFRNSDFWIVIGNTIRQLAVVLLTSVPLGLIFAYLIFRTRKLFKLYRFVVFLPVILSASSVSLMFTLIFNTDFGPVNSILSSIGLEGLRQNWLSDANVVLYTVMVPMVYQSTAITTIITLAGIQMIPDDVLESAVIDGANSFQTFFHIVTPMVRDILFTCTILMTSNVFKSFEHSYIMTWGGLGVRSSYLSVYLYQESFKKLNFGKGSAVSIVVLGFALFFILVIGAFRGRSHKKE